VIDLQYTRSRSFGRKACPLLFHHPTYFRTQDIANTVYQGTPGVQGMVVKLNAPKSRVGILGVGDVVDFSSGLQTLLYGYWDLSVELVWDLLRE
jgi:hypothetical protein